MAGKSDRTIVRTHTVTYYDGYKPKTFSKDFLGTISEEARGQSRYSIDTVVISAGQTNTIAEIREQGASSMPAEASVWADFAKWYKLQRRLGKV